MNVLAIDGALGGFSAAVSHDGSVRAARREDGTVALEAGLSLVRDVMARSGVSAADLDRVAVGTGPGGFTGLRVAIAYAKSLAQAWERPLVAVSSFDLLEYGTDFDPVLAVVVGRPGVVSLRYRTGGAVSRASGRVEEALSAVVPREATSLTAIGASKDVLAALAERGIVVQSLAPAVVPPAAAAALIGATRAPAAAVHAVRADYGELPAATLPKR